MCPAGGAKLIVGAIRGWTRDAGGREAYEPLFRSSMESILARAEQLGIQVAFEAISRIDSDAYCSLSETAEFIRSFRSPALRLQVDSIHLHTNGETDFYQGLLKAGDLIGQVDISDVDRMAPDGRHFDFPLLIQALKETGFQDYLVFEFRANPLPTRPRPGWTTSALCCERAQFVPLPSVRQPSDAGGEGLHLSRPPQL